MDKRAIVLAVDIVMDKFRICPYYCCDEEPCIKAESGGGWLTCNCDGDIRKCDLPLKYFEENDEGVSKK